MESGVRGAQGDVSLFDGIADDELEELLQRLEVRRFPAGATVVAEGDAPREIYVIRSGAADVLVVDEVGVEHRVAVLGAGATIGEMSLLTREPATATVRATEELTVLVVRGPAFEAMTGRFPRIYRNLGMILARRLARTNLLVVGDEPARIIRLENWAAPPLLGWALAACVAWHTREPTLLLVSGDEPPDDVRALAAAPERSPARSRHDAMERAAFGAHIAVVSGGPSALAAALSEFSIPYEYVLVEAAGDAEPAFAGDPAVALAAANERAAPRARGAYTVRAWEAGDGTAGPRDGVVSVPALERTEEQALATGMLPAAGGASRALGWVARDLAGLKVGVALGAGSIRGYAHFGVLRALDRHGVPIDYIAGTSIGAAAAATYALGYSPDEGADIFTKCASALFRPTVSRKSLLSNRPFRRTIRRYTGDRRIEDLTPPLALVGTDLLTQREVVFRRGLVWQAVVASASIPGVYPALGIGTYTIVDGGIVDPVPSRIVTEMGAGAVIGVKLIHRAVEADFGAEAVVETGRPVSAVAAILGAIEIMQTRIAPEASEAPTVMITPELRELPAGHVRNLAAGRRYVDDGDAAATAALPRLASALPWLR